MATNSNGGLNMDYSGSNPFTPREDAWLASISEIEDLVPGQATMDRSSIIGTHSTNTQSLILTYFTSVRTEIVSKLELAVGSPSAAATPTLIRFGVYKVESNGNLTLVASTPNDTTLFAVAFTKYSKALSVPYQLEKGARYAVGFLIVTAAAMPGIYGSSATIGVINSYPPRASAIVPSQSDLPASIAVGSLGDTASLFFSALLP